MPSSRQSRPRRYEIRQAILDFIAQQGYKPGDQLPSEQELGEILGVSRFSMREAIHLLEEERIINTRHGTGRFLAAAPGSFDIDLTTLQSVTEMLAGYQIGGENALLRVERRRADETIAGSLRLQTGEAVVTISRLRYAGKIPIIYSQDILPEKLLPAGWKDEDFTGSLFDYLQGCGIVLDNSQAVIRTAILGEEEIPFTHDPTTPWILLEQVIYDQDNKPVILCKDYHRGDYISFHVRRFRR